MSKTNTLQALTAQLDAQTPKLGELDAYYDGRQPLSFLSTEARAALGTRFGRMASNIPRLQVTSLAERLRITGLTLNGKPDRALWQAWKTNDLDQTAGVAHREALALGRSFVTVWAGPSGAPQVTVESAHQMTATRHPATREVTAAVKRWVADGRAHAVLYEPDQITRFTSKAAVADPAALPATGWDVADTVANPLGVVPVVPMVNTDRLLDTQGRSEMADLIPLADALNKLLADLMVSSEYFARPRRWATGVELEEDENGHAVNPFPEGYRMMLSESPDTKFGQLEAADLAAYESGVGTLLGQIMAVSALPAHYIGQLSSTPASADALRAAEASLAARAEARQAQFGRAWEQVARLMHAVTHGTDPAAVDAGVVWADPTTRSVAQEADAVVKLHAAGLLPADYALARLGYTDEQVDAIRQARRAEALDSTGVDLQGLLP